MVTIVTLCEACRAEYAEAFTLKPLAIETTTEKKTKCEKCGRKFSSPYDLKQYMVSRCRATSGSFNRRAE